MTLERVDRPGVLYAEGGSTTVWLDFKAKRSVALPDWMRELLA